MKRPDARAFLFDIQQACRVIGQFTSGMTLPRYVADLKTRSAVERQLEIIGEALNQMLEQFPEMEEQFPEAPQIISFGTALFTVTDPSRIKSSGVYSKAASLVWLPRSTSSSRGTTCNAAREGRK